MKSRAADFIDNTNFQLVILRTVRLSIQTKSNLG